MSSPQSISIQEFRAQTACGRKGARATPEEDLHKGCMEWVKLSENGHPILRWMVHVPNGGKRSRGEAGKLKAMGVKPGYPDLTLPRRCGVWRGLAIELKALKGVVSDDQEDWLDMFSEEGWLVAVCRSFEEFHAVVKVFLHGEGNTALPQLWRSGSPR